MKRLAIALFLFATPLQADEPRRDRFGDPLPAGAIARLGTVHTHPAATGIAFSADGREIVTTSFSSVRHWNVESGRLGKTKEYPVTIDDGPRQVIAANGRIAAIVADGRLDIQDLETDKRLHRFEIGRLKELAKRNGGNRSLSLLGISPMGDLVVMRVGNAKDILAFRNGKMETWPGPESDAEQYSYSPDGHRIAFSADGRWVAFQTRGETGEVLFRSTTASTPAAKFKASGLTHAIAPNGSTLVVGSEKPGWTGPRVRLVDSKSGKLIANGGLSATGAVQAATFSHDGRRLAIATDSEISLWDVATKRRLWRMAGAANCLAFSADNRRLAGIDHLLKIWDAQTGSLVSPDFGPVPERVAGPVRGRYVVYRNDTARQFQAWDWTTARPALTVTYEATEHATAWLSTDGTRLYAVDDRIARSWDIASGKLLRTFDPIPPDLKGGKWTLNWWAAPTLDATAFSLVFTEGSFNELSSKCVFVHWDANTGKLVFRREHTLQPFRMVTVGPDAWSILSYGDQGNQVIDARTGRPRPQFVPELPAGLRSWGVFGQNPGDRFEAVEAYSDSDDLHETHVIETASRKSLLRIPGKVNRVESGNSISISYDYSPSSFSPDGRWLAMARRGGVEVWDLIGQTSLLLPGTPPANKLRADDYDRDIAFLSNTHLVARYAGSSPLVWALPPAVQKPPVVQLSAATWNDLGNEQPLIAQRAVWALKSDPKAGIELLRRVKRVDGPDEKLLAALLVDLGSNQFAARETATKRLRDYGRAAEAFLTTAKPTNAEQQRRVRYLLDEVQTMQRLTVAERRALRAVQAAQLLGGDAARALLTDWSKGDDAAVLTREAKAALQRIMP